MPIAPSDCLLAQPLAAPNPHVPATMGAAACQAEAERLLLAAALADASNQRFVLISETCIPLYPAPVVWAQLLSEPLARMHACRNDSDSGDAGRRQAFRCARALVCITLPSNARHALGSF